MTAYDRIVKELRERKMESALFALEAAVDEEAAALGNPQWPTGAISGWKGFLTQAQDYYGEEIEECIHNERPLTAGQIIGLRRKPTAWAIADLIRRARKSA
jgi:hypothetical protein